MFGNVHALRCSRRHHRVTMNKYEVGSGERLSEQVSA